MSLELELTAEFDRDIENGMRAVFEEYRLAVRTDPAMPEDTGKLSQGVDYFRQSFKRGSVSAELRSLARTDAGADYGTILDRSTGKIVTKPSGAFGPFKTPVQTRTGSTRFLKSFRVTTKHVGWWDKVNSFRNWQDAVETLERFDL